MANILEAKVVRRLYGRTGVLGTCALLVAQWN
jgi:hypothetical protein